MLLKQKRIYLITYSSHNLYSEDKMCSVVGIISEKENRKIAYDIYDALLSLQHRGQDAAGIATLDLDEKIHSKKVEGLALNFSKKDIANLNGNIGLGHTRYSTTGSTKMENAHPYLINYPVSIAVACNGDTQNYEEIKKFLKEKGVFLQTDCDIEAIAKLFAYAYSKSKDVFQSASFVMKKIIGAYSIICIIQNKGLLAFRDPYGIRPMVMGKKSSPHDSYIFASESVALDCLDYKRVCNVKPGEAIFIDRDLQCTRKMICNQDKKAHCMFEWVYLARPDSIIEDISVYGARENLGKKLAQIVK
ncbi:MAG: amidophosphoribosyltransferase, partial [Candidatus Aenigmarchaeota archaeon]|nr:amidophosphoribosyltransferase [Candidatus Aenigmarchaeota archaeon]